MPSLNYNQSTKDRIADLVLGMRVDRPAAILAAAQVLFNVTGGAVLLTGFYGEIMVVIDAIANQLTLNYDDDTGAALDTVLGTIGADIQGFVAGRMIYLPVVGGALTNMGTCGACPITIAPPYVLRPGHMDLTSTGTTVTGTIRWSAFYIPLDEGARITAA